MTLNSGLSHRTSSLVLRFWNSIIIASTGGGRVASTRRFDVETVTAS